MRLAFKELLRTPTRFVPVTVAMTLLVVLLVVLGGFLDGLEGSQTGAYRAQTGNQLAYDADSDRQIGRSLVSADQYDEVQQQAAVTATGRISQISTTAAPDGIDLDNRDDLEQVVDVIFTGYELGTEVLPDPPADGVVIDAALTDLIDVGVGDTLGIGPNAEPVTVSAIVDDLTQGSPTIWIGLDAWTPIASAALPTGVPPEGSSQIVVVRTDPADANVVVEGLDIVTVDEAIGALDVVNQQTSTFQGIIIVTFVVTLIVVALFFALITLERTQQYAVLKAIGASSRDLLVSISTQAIAISIVAIVGGLLLAAALVGVLPPDLPVRVEPSRLWTIAIGTLVTALFGSLFTLRRISSIDPAEAIG